MNILLVTPEYPYPPDQGGRIRMLNLIKQLCVHHQIHLVSVNLSSSGPVDREALTPYCRTIHTVEQPTSWLRTSTRVVHSVLARRPFVTLKHSPRNLASTIRAVADQEKPDIVLAEFHYISDCVQDLDIRRVIDMHNVDYLLYDRFAQAPRWSIKKAHGRIQRRLIYEFERLIPQRFDACVTVSDKDKRILEAISGVDNIYVVPNGVDVEYFRPGVTSQHQYDIAFVGSMDYYPNVDAALFLCYEVMPRIWSDRPHTRLAIVGRNPAAVVRNCKMDYRIDVTGTVADVRPYLAGASIVAVPLRIGGGTRLKVLEAAAMAKPIVGTPVGLEGLHLQHKRHVLVAEQADDFAQCVLALLQDPAQRAQLGHEAHKFVVQRYSWPTCAALMERVLQSVLLS